jgi:hypothetical protein
MCSTFKFNTSGRVVLCEDGERLATEDDVRACREEDECNCVGCIFENHCTEARQES